jgi:murein DD-endopeptidase MepM/ murein hydrolase activator NlpD
MVKKNKTSIIDKVLETFHLVVVNEKTLKKRKIFSASRLKITLVSIFGLTVILSAVFLIIYFTPLKESFRGYTSTELRASSLNNAIKLDSLETLYSIQNNYISSLKNLLSGKIDFEDLSKDSLLEAYSTNDLDFVNINAEDSILRAIVEEEDKYNLTNINVDKLSAVLFNPANGGISSEFSLQEKHFGVDITLPENSAVYSVSDGRVLFAEWTSETGFVIIIEHLNGLTSVYKHNSSLSKTQGEHVRRGEVIGFSGNTGELTSGPHLHFELWFEGDPVDPLDFIEF